ncbi:GNAT family N-acetyltransferase [Marinomonas agarivorans]|nr:GNAT family N-acetyltransferase [Marinomonas agarivorans]
MNIVVDTLTGTEIQQFLFEHLDDMQSVSPPESKHALDLSGLQAPDVTFWTAYEQEKPIACGALKQLSDTQAEIKSMRVDEKQRGRGLGSKMLSHIISEGKKRQYHSLVLETGSMAFFESARQLYLKHGFVYCQPFGNYVDDPNSVFMELNLAKP